MAKAACARLGMRVLPALDPAEALLDELWRTLNNVAFYEKLVYELAPEALTDGTGLAHPLVGLYNAERGHYVKVSAEAVRAKVSVRVIEIAEDQARLVASVLIDFARRMQLDPTSPAVREAGRASLQLHAGGRA